MASNKPPPGSTSSNARMVATYCRMMSRVLAPGRVSKDFQGVLETSSMQRLDQSTAM